MVLDRLCWIPDVLRIHGYSGYHLQMRMNCYDLIGIVQVPSQNELVGEHRVMLVTSGHEDDGDHTHRRERVLFEEEVELLPLHGIGGGNNFYNNQST